MSIQTVLSIIIHTFIIALYDSKTNYKNENENVVKNSIDQFDT